MKVKSYYELQNERWYEQYLATEKLLSETEDALCQLEQLVLKHISDETIRLEICKIVDAVWRGAR